LKTAVKYCLKLQNKMIVIEDCVLSPQTKITQ